MSDIFGQAMMGHWQGDRETPLIVWRDDGHGEAQGPAMWFEDRLWPAEALLEEHVSGRVLDIGCGAGRHVRHFEAKGFEVTGLDRSPLAAEVCRARGCRKVIAADILDADLPEGGFETALLFGNNIGIGGSRTGIAEMLAKLRPAVTGQVLLTSIDVRRARAPRHRAYLERNRVERRSPGAMRLRLEYGAEGGDWFDWLHPTPSELRRAAASAGWTVAEMRSSRHGAYAAVLRPASR